MRTLLRSSQGALHDFLFTQVRGYRPRLDPMPDDQLTNEMLFGNLELGFAKSLVVNGGSIE